MGFVMSGMAFGQILGVPLGTLFAGWFGFQTPFVAFGVVMIFAWLGTMLVLAPTTTERAAPLTLKGGVQAYASVLRQPALLGVALASTTMMLSVSSYILNRLCEGKRAEHDTIVEK